MLGIRVTREATVSGSRRGFATNAISLKAKASSSKPRPAEDFSKPSKIPVSNDTPKRSHIELKSRRQKRVETTPDSTARENQVAYLAPAVPPAPSSPKMEPPVAQRPSLSNSDKNRVKTMWYNSHLTFPASDAVYHLQQSTEMALIMSSVSSTAIKDTSSEATSIQSDSHRPKVQSPNSFSVFADAAFLNVMTGAFPIGTIDDTRTGDWDALLTSRVVSSHFKPLSEQQEQEPPKHLVATSVVDAFDPILLMTDTGRSTVTIIPAPVDSSSDSVGGGGGGGAYAQRPTLADTKPENKWTVLDTDVTPTALLAAETYAHHKAVIDEEDEGRKGHRPQRMLKKEPPTPTNQRQKDSSPEQAPEVIPLDTMLETSGHFISSMANSSYHESLWYTLLVNRRRNEVQLPQHGEASGKIVFNASERSAMGMLRRRKLAIAVKDCRVWDMITRNKAINVGDEAIEVVPFHQRLLRHILTTSGGAPSNTLHMGLRRPTPVAAQVEHPMEFRAYLSSLKGLGSDAVRQELSKVKGYARNSWGTQRDFGLGSEGQHEPRKDANSIVYVDDPRPAFDPLNPFADPHSLSSPTIMSRTGSSLGFTMSSASSSTAKSMPSSERSVEEGEQLVTVDDGPLGMWITGPKAPAWSAFIARLVEPDVQPLLDYCGAGEVPSRGSDHPVDSYSTLEKVNNRGGGTNIATHSQKARREAEIADSLRKRAKLLKVAERQVPTPETLALDARIHCQPMASVMAAATMRYKWHLLYGQEYCDYQAADQSADQPPLMPTYGQCYIHLRALCQLCANDWCGNAIVYERDVTLVSDVSAEVLAAMRNATPLEAVMAVADGDPLKPTAPAHIVTPFSNESAEKPKPTGSGSPFSLATLSLTTLVSQATVYGQFIEAAVHGPSTPALSGSSMVGSGVGKGFGIMPSLGLVHLEKRSTSAHAPEGATHPGTVFPPFRDFVLETIDSPQSKPFEGIDYIFRMSTVVPSFAPNTAHSIADPIHLAYAHQSVWFPLFHAFLPVPACIGVIGPNLLLSPSTAAGAIEGNPFLMPLKNAQPPTVANPEIMRQTDTLRTTPIDFSSVFGVSGMTLPPYQFISSAPTAGSSSGASVGGYFAPTTAAANPLWFLEMLSVYCDCRIIEGLQRRLNGANVAKAPNTYSNRGASPAYLEVSPISKVLLISTARLLPCDAGDGCWTWPLYANEERGRRPSQNVNHYVGTTHIRQASEELQQNSYALASEQADDLADPSAEAIGILSERVWVVGLHPLTFARRVWPYLVVLAKRDHHHNPTGTRYTYSAPLGQLADLLLYSHEHGADRGTAMLALYLLAAREEMVRPEAGWERLCPVTSLDISPQGQVTFASSQELSINC